MPSTTRRRSTAVLTVLVLVAGMFAAALPASAATTPNDKALFTACPSGVIPSAAFTDTTGSFAAADIDCVAYYGITKGTSATAYSPTADVTREQMALFLTRAAGPAGITLAASPADPGFSDDDDLSAESKLAIAQIADLGITKGTTTTTYSPKAKVTRQQMALFLSRFLAKAVKGPGAYGEYSASQAITGTAHDFTDIGGVSNEAYNAIVAIFHGGVTTGATATTFAPFANVTREQMAAFISRTLAHTNARPAGVNIQAAPLSGFAQFTPAVAISYRDSSFMPVSNVLIDVFQRFTAAGATEKAALKADGTCDITGAGLTSVGGSTTCAIDLTDNATNASGNVLVGAAVGVGTGATTWWAWTGAIGATFDADTTAVSAVTVTESGAATNYKVTSSIATNAATTTSVEGVVPAGTYKQVKFGTNVTVNAQLRSTAPANVAKADVSVVFTRTQYDKNGALVSVISTTVKTDATGLATFSFSQADPSTSAGDDGYDIITVTSSGLTQEGTGSPLNVKWLDSSSAVTKLVLSQDSDYTVAASTATGSVTHASKGTVYDQYGATMSGVAVAFSNNDELVTPVTRFTDGSGVATLVWARVGNTSESDTLSAVADPSGANVADNGDLTIYWVLELADGGTSTGAKTVAVWDSANDAIVYGAGGDVWNIVYYDANDQFNAGGATTYALFDAAVADQEKTTPTTPYTTVNVTIYKVADASVSSFTLG